MKTYIFFALTAITVLLTSCGGNSYTVENAEDILIQNEGVIAGVTLGDDWTSTKDRILKEQQDLLFLMNEEMTVLTTDKDNFDNRIHMIFDVDTDNTIYGLTVNVVKPEKQRLGDLQVKLIDHLEGKFENQSDESGAYTHFFEEGGYLSVNGYEKEENYDITIYYMM